MAKPAPKSAPAPAPVPANRMVQSDMVRVRARAHLAEIINGDRQQFLAGDEFSITAARVAALGALVEPVKPEAPTA